MPSTKSRRATTIWAGSRVTRQEARNDNTVVGFGQIQKKRRTKSDCFRGPCFGASNIPIVEVIHKPTTIRNSADQP